jgi:dephospho-CoA kinase
MIEVGLTGGIGCGKSTVSGMLRTLGALVIDADELAHDALLPGGAAYRDVVSAFGSGILRPDGGIDRAALGEIVFGDGQMRRLLESIVHPAVFGLEQRMLDRFRQERPDSVVVFDAALLIESGAYARMDRVVVVWCSPETQSRRLAAKGLEPKAAAQRRAAQMPVEEKLTYADHVIDNDGPIEETRRQVEGLFRELLQYV